MIVLIDLGDFPNHEQGPNFRVLRISEWLCMALRELVSSRVTSECALESKFWKRAKSEINIGLTANAHVGKLLLLAFKAGFLS